MLGAIFGDIVGSRFEFHNCRSKSFELFHPDCSFTDDTLMTLAVAAALSNAGGADAKTLAREAVCSMPSDSTAVSAPPTWRSFCGRI